MGETNHYYRWKGEAHGFEQKSNWEKGEADRLDALAGDDRYQENLFNGVAYTSYGMGGVLIIHSIFRYGRQDRISMTAKADGEKIAGQINWRF